MSDNPIKNLGDHAKPGKAKGFPKGTSGNPGGKSELKKILEAANLLNPACPKTPAEARAKWWATVAPIAFAGPQSSSDKNWSYAAKEIGERLFGKPKESVEISGGLSPDQQALFEALKLTPHERRLAAQDATIPEAAEDDAALAEMLDGDDGASDNT